MAKSSVYEGKTYDEAVKKGLDDLGLTRAEATITLIEEGKGGFLGIGARPFRVSIMRRPGGAVREPEERGERRVQGTRGRDDRRGGRGGRDRDRGREGGRDEKPGGREGGRDEKQGGRDRDRDRQGGRDRDRGRREQQPVAASAPEGARAEAPRGERPERGERRGERRERRPDRSREDRPREERQPRPAEAAPAPVAEDEDVLMPAAEGAAPAAGGAEGEGDADSPRRRRRRGRRGGRGRRRGGEGHHEGGAPSEPGAVALAEPDSDDEGDDDEGVSTSNEMVAAPMESAPVAAYESEPAASSPVEPSEPPASPEPPAPRAERFDRGDRGDRRDRRDRRDRDRDRGPRREHESSEPLMSPEDLAETSKRLTENLLKGMGFDAKVTVSAEGDRADVTVEVAEDDDLLTGQKGEVRQAMQHLLNRFLNKGEGSRYHLQLEINDFWQRREDELAALARGLAEDAIANNAEMVTEYLNSQERRIVHVTLREDTRVKTYALGTGMIKRVAVAPADFPERTGEEDAG